MRNLWLSGAILAIACGAQAAERPLTIDTHVDIPVDYMRESRFDVGNPTGLKVDLGKMERGGLDAAFFVIYVEQGAHTPAGYADAVAQAERKYSAIEMMLQRYPDRIRLATTPQQVRDNHAAGVLSAMVGIENGYSLGHDIANLDAAYRRGARYLGLTHTGHNDICTSSGARPEFGDQPAGDTGLSAFGREVVARANTLGIMVDVSHASDACVRDVLQASTAPVIASHSAAQALVDHPRNLDDELLSAIADRDGVAQIVAYTYFLKADPAREAAEEALQQAVAQQAGAAEFDSEQHESLPAYVEGLARIEQEHPLATLDDYLDHIEHAVEVAGIDHVGIASDFDGGGGITGWIDASQTANVTAGLRGRGFSEADIGKIWGGNLLRVWQAVEQAASAPTAAAAPDTVPDTAFYDATVDDLMTRYQLPGLAVGVIENGKVTYTRTAGEIAAGSGQPVTPDTLFKIASNTKAMTASVLARLVDAGKLRWDDPVVKHLPQFRMHDPWVTEHMQVRDLLVHNSGLPEGGGDLMLWPEPNDFDRADIISGLAHIKPAYGFRAGYAYDNLLYVVAGELAAAVGGAPYEELVRREVFQPLVLDRCMVGEIDRGNVGDIARPHRREDGRNVAGAVDGDIIPAITSAAAGGIRCSLGDMLAWARNWLAPTAQQLQWLSPEQREAMWTARTPMPISQRRRDWDNTHYYAYALGFRLADVDGAWTVSHTGTLSGMYSVMTLLPDSRSGFVVLINGDADEARTVANEVLLKHFTAPRANPTVAGYAKRIASQPAPAGAPAAPDTSARTPVTAAALAGRLGRYTDPWFGAVSICSDGDAVRFTSAKSPRLRGQVMAMGDRLLVDWDGPGLDEAWLDFAVAGTSPALTMAKVDPNADFSSDYEDLAFGRSGDCD